MSRINLIHTALDAGNVDICLDGDVVLSNVAYGDYANFAQFAGCCYNNFEVKVTGTDTVLTSATCFSFPCEGDYSLVIHWNLTGTDVTMNYMNNCINGYGNFIFRHVAGVGKVNVCKTDISPIIQVYSDISQNDVVCGSFFPEGTNEVTIKLSSDDSELVVKSDLVISNDTLTILYLTGKIGSPETFDTIVEVICQCIY